jgi:hypothetical protein
MTVQHILRLMAAHSKLWHPQRFSFLDAMAESQKRPAGELMRLRVIT